MIEEKDVDNLIKAKRDRFAVDALMALSSIALAVLILLEAFNVEHEYTIVIATASMMSMIGAMGQNKWVSVSRSQLIQTLDRIVNRDSSALKILAKKRKTL
ncbi:hypothetical protein [Marinimicrobium sp. C2-29]|uniref:hypothetical protein n=1 Tax=Marinimicrobium sp. C2-29 TaxID=3139825 RepID=UPI003139BDF4